MPFPRKGRQNPQNACNGPDFQILRFDTLNTVDFLQSGLIARLRRHRCSSQPHSNPSQERPQLPQLNLPTTTRCGGRTGWGAGPSPLGAPRHKSRRRISRDSRSPRYVRVQCNGYFISDTYCDKISQIVNSREMSFRISHGRILLWKLTILAIRQGNVQRYRSR